MCGTEPSRLPPHPPPLAHHVKSKAMQTHCCIFLAAGGILTLTELHSVMLTEKIFKRRNWEVGSRKEIKDRLSISFTTATWQRWS